MISARTVISFVCLFTIFQTCHCINCYSCTSDIHQDDCRTNVNDDFLINCNDGEKCGTIIRSNTESNDTQVYRGCAPKEMKYNIATCNTDKCNSIDEEDISTVNKTYNNVPTIIKCYRCHYSYNASMTVEGTPECGKIVNDDYLIDCQSNEECLISFESGNGDTKMARGCTLKGTKWTPLFCNTDGCNGKPI